MYGVCYLIEPVYPSDALLAWLDFLRTGFFRQNADTSVPLDVLYDLTQEQLSFALQVDISNPLHGELAACSPLDCTIAINPTSNTANDLRNMMTTFFAQ